MNRQDALERKGGLKAGRVAGIKEIGMWQRNACCKVTGMQNR